MARCTFWKCGSTMTWHYPEPRGRALSSRTFICCVKEFLHFLSFLYLEFQATASAYRQGFNIALGTWSRGESIMLEIRSRSSYLGINTTRHLLMMILPTVKCFICLISSTVYMMALHEQILRVQNNSSASLCLRSSSAWCFQRCCRCVPG